MTYSVKELFHTLQGEGAQSGRSAVFCRFSGCNLWSGRQQDRGTAICKFCDTNFVGTDGPGGGKFDSATLLADAIDAAWLGYADQTRKYVVCTGGEPLLQLDGELLDALHERKFTVAVETNGTILAPAGLDWICVSPKANAPLVQVSGNELKLVYPQVENSPVQFEHLDFEHFFIQPMDGNAILENTRRSIDFCKTHPQWRLSLQTHKLLGIP